MRAKRKEVQEYSFSIFISEGRLMASFVFNMVLCLKTSTVNYHTTLELVGSFSNAY